MSNRGYAAGGGSGGSGGSSGPVTSVNGQQGVVVLNTNDINQGSSNFYYTEARFDASLAGSNTNELAEGSSNFYFTNARAQAALLTGGVLPIANGGTGASLAVTAFNNLSPLTTKGDLIGNDGTNDVRIPVGATNGWVLVVDSATASGLGYTSVSAGGGGGTPGGGEGSVQYNSGGAFVGATLLTINGPSLLMSLGSTTTINKLSLESGAGNRSFLQIKQGAGTTGLLLGYDAAGTAKLSNNAATAFSIVGGASGNVELMSWPSEAQGASFCVIRDSQGTIQARFSNTRWIFGANSNLNSRYFFSGGCIGLFNEIAASTGTLSDLNSVVGANCGSTNVQTLPADASNDLYVIYKNDATANPVLINQGASRKLNGVTFMPMYAQWDSALVHGVNASIAIVVATNKQPMIQTFTTSYTPIIFDDTILVDATSGALSVTLPVQAGIRGKCFTIIKADASVNAVTVQGTVSGVANPVLSAQYAKIRCQTDGTNWWDIT